MKTELTKCPICERVLVGQEEVHAIEGLLFCSKACAIKWLENSYIKDALELAKEAYDEDVEIVSTEDVLGEDLQEVRITHVCTKVIKLPANLTEEEAICEAKDLISHGIVCIDADDSDESTLTYELVKDDNSSCNKEAAND